MDNRVVSAVEDYIYDLVDPQRNWPKYYFKQVSFSRWAAEEILELVKQTLSLHESIDVISDFSIKMKNFALMDHDDKDDARIFYVAYEVGTDILDILNAMK